MKSTRDGNAIQASDLIVKGDSFYAIHWGSCKSKCPWRLADWVEEVQAISGQLSCSFNHILGKANETVDFLARKGVSA